MEIVPIYPSEVDGVYETKHLSHEAAETPVLPDKINTHSNLEQ